MSHLTKLPDAEFEVMKTIWENDPPVTTIILMEQLGNKKGWKTPALITLLNRLMDREFLKSEKNGKLRYYYPLIEKEQYLKFETSNFMKRFHENSLSSFVASMYDGNNLEEEELQELLKWAEERK